MLHSCQLHTPRFKSSQTIEELVESNSPNYIVVKDDGSMELVINKYKMDSRSKAMDYDPERNFDINTSATRQTAKQAARWLSTLRDQRRWRETIT